MIRDHNGKLTTLYGMVSQRTINLFFMVSLQDTISARAVSSIPIIKPSLCIEPPVISV